MDYSSIKSWQDLITTYTALTKTNYVLSHKYDLNSGWLEKTPTMKQLAEWRHTYAQEKAREIWYATTIRLINTIIRQFDYGAAERIGDRFVLTIPYEVNIDVCNLVAHIMEMHNYVVSFRPHGRDITVSTLCI
jgi:hypothetical protein